jgi:site-specific DNA recombinase
MSIQIPSNGQKHAAIYARVSTSEQAETGFSLPTQVEACHAVATQEGYTVLPSHLFKDDYTGMSLQRPQLQKLRDTIAQGALHAVVIYDLDRLSRKLAHQLLLRDELDEAGVVLHVVSMPVTTTTPETLLFANMRGSIAEYERLKLLERTNRGRRGRAREGLPPGGPPPFGYTRIRKDGKGTHYEVSPEEAAIVQRIFQLYLDGKSQEGIAALLTREGVAAPATRRKGPRHTLPVSVWHQAVIAQILASKTYLGTLHYGKRRRIPGQKNSDKKTRWQAVPEAEWIPSDIPPLITLEVFTAVQAQRARNKTQSPRNRKHAYLFTAGRLRCGQCGSAMTGYLDSHGVARYRCGRKAYLDLVTPHTKRSVQASALESRIWNTVREAVDNPARIANAIAARHTADTD